MLPSNEEIARWMGEEYSTGHNTPWRYPDYATDPATALRVLARMNTKCNGYFYELFPYAGIWQVNKYQEEAVENNDTYYLANTHAADTPCAAIVAAWAAEFGGEE